MAIFCGDVTAIGLPGILVINIVRLTKQTVEAWTESIKLQLSRFLEFDHAPNAARVFNNYDWFASINIIEFLRDCGTRFTINYMLAKETERL